MIINIINDHVQSIWFEKKTHHKGWILSIVTNPQDPKPLSFPSSKRKFPKFQTTNHSKLKKRETQTLSTIAYNGNRWFNYFQGGPQHS